MNPVISFIFSNLFIGYVGKCWGFLDGSAGKESASSAEGLGSIPGLGRSPGEGNGYPLHYFGLENSMDYGPWGAKESDTTEQLLLTGKCCHNLYCNGNYFFFFLHICVSSIPLEYYFN